LRALLGGFDCSLFGIHKEDGKHKEIGKGSADGEAQRQLYEEKKLMKCQIKRKVRPDWVSKWKGEEGAVKPGGYEDVKL
jgi:hypothetical protein